MYVIKRTDQGGGYLGHAEDGHTWTKHLQRAIVFSSREAAEKNCCPENEIAVSVAREMGEE